MKEDTTAEEVIHCYTVGELMRSLSTLDPDMRLVVSYDGAAGPIWCVGVWRTADEVYRYYDEHGYRDRVDGEPGPELTEYGILTITTG